jgi:hypothetical protein
LGLSRQIYEEAHPILDRVGNHIELLGNGRPIFRNTDPSLILESFGQVGASATLQAHSVSLVRITIHPPSSSRRRLEISCSGSSPDLAGSRIRFVIGTDAAAKGRPTSRPRYFQEQIAV